MTRFISPKKADQVLPSAFRVHFHQDTEGRYDHNSTSLNNKVVCAAYKYTGQSRLYVRVVDITMPNITILGQRCKIFDYTGQKITTIPEY